MVVYVLCFCRFPIACFNKLGSCSCFFAVLLIDYVLKLNLKQITNARTYTHARTHERTHARAHTRALTFAQKSYSKFVCLLILIFEYLLIIFWPLNAFSKTWIGLCEVRLPALLWLPVLRVPTVYQVSNKLLSNQYFIHCLFRGHYNIINRLRRVLRHLSLLACHNRFEY